jgi:hypothetical protein
MRWKLLAAVLAVVAVIACLLTAASCDRPGHVTRGVKLDVRTESGRPLPGEFEHTMRCYLDGFERQWPGYTASLDGAWVVVTEHAIPCGGRRVCNGTYLWRYITIRWLGDSLHDGALAHEMGHHAMHVSRGHGDSLHLDKSHWRAVREIRDACAISLAPRAPAIYPAERR